MPIFSKLAHFLASFLPVHFVVLVRGIEDQCISIIWIFGALCAMGIGANLFVLVRFNQRTDGIFVEVKSFAKSEDNILFYLLSIVPVFLSADFTSIYSAVIFAVIFSSVVAVCFTSNYLFVNPIVYFAGIRFYDATIVSKGVESKAVILSNESRLMGKTRLKVSILGADGWYIAAANS